MKSAEEIRELRRQRILKNMENRMKKIQGIVDIEQDSIDESDRAVTISAASEPCFHIPEANFDFHRTSSVEPNNEPSFPASSSPSSQSQDMRRSISEMPVNSIFLLCVCAILSGFLFQLHYFKDFSVFTPLLVVDLPLILLDKNSFRNNSSSILLAIMSLVLKNEELVKSLKVALRLIEVMTTHFCIYTFLFIVTSYAIQLDD